MFNYSQKHLHGRPVEKESHGFNHLESFFVHLQVKMKQLFLLPFLITSAVGGWLRPFENLGLIRAAPQAGKFFWPCQENMV
jgi:hypothetical protein